MLYDAGYASVQFLFYVGLRTYVSAGNNLIVITHNIAKLAFWGNSGY